MSRGSPVFDEELARSLPLPLAQLYRRAHNAKTPLERHQGAYYLWEAALKLLASVSVVEYAERGGRDPALERLLQNLARPSAGHWWELVRRLVPTLATSAEGAPDPAFERVRELVLGRSRADLPRAAGLDAALGDAIERPAGARSTVRLSELFDRLVQYRNREFGHGAAGQRPASFYHAMSHSLLAGLTEVLRELDPLAGRDLIYIAEVRRQGDGRWLVERYRLRGEVPQRLETLELPAAATGELPHPERVYVVGPDPARPPRSLHPLVVHDPETGEVAFLNARRGEAGAEHLCYTSGRILRAEGLAADHRALLASVLGGRVEEDQVRVWAERSRADEPAEEASVAPPPGRRLGEYDLLGRIGRGGMGVVYRAWQPSLGRQVAIKCLFHAGDPKVESRFAREIRVLGRVEHPHLVKIYGSGSEGEQWFYAMELVEGPDLGRVLDRLAGSSASELGESDWRRALSSARVEARREEAPLDGDEASGHMPSGEGDAEQDEEEDAPERAQERPLSGPPGGVSPARTEMIYLRQAVAAIRQVAGAAHALHEAGVVHRDIKPGNILLTGEGAHAVLMDLGLAQLADDAQGRLTRTRQFVGTLRYASPEQVLAAGTLDRRSDIYALGTTLWELLTLRPIFGVDDATPTPELMLKIQSEDPVRPRRFNPRVPHDLEAIVMKCLEKHPGRRYSTAAELAADLERWERGDPVHAQPQTATYLLGKFVRRHRGRFALAAAALLVAAGLIVASVVRIHRAHRAAQVALFDLDTAAGLEATDRGDRALALLRFASAASVPHGDPHREEANRLRLASWLEESPVPVRAFPHEGEDLRQLLVHPETTRLLALSEDDRAFLWDVAREERLELPGGGEPVTAAAWNPGGDWLVLGRPDGSAVVFDSPSGAELRRLDGPGGRVEALAFSRDGGLLAVGAGGARIWNVAGERWGGATLSHPAEVRWLAFDSGPGRLVTSAADDRVRVFAIEADGSLLEPLFEVPHLVRYNIPGLLPSNLPWSPAIVDGDRSVLTVSAPTEVTWWNLATGELQRTVRGADRILGLYPNGDGSRVAIVDRWSWQVWSARGLEAEDENPDGHLAAAWSPDGASLFISSRRDGVVEWTFPARSSSQELWQARAEQRIGGAANLLEVTPGARFVVLADGEGLVRLVRPGQKEVARSSLLPVRSWATQFVPAAHEDVVFPATDVPYQMRPHSSVRLHRRSDLRPTGPPLETGGSIALSGLASGGETAFTVSRRYPEEFQGDTGARPEVWIDFWSLPGGKRRAEVRLPAVPEDARLSKGGRKLAVAAGDEVLLVDTASGHIAWRQALLPEDEDFAFSPGASRLAVWTPGRPVRIFRLGRDDEPHTLPVACRTVEFSPSGRFLVTRNDAREARIWAMETGEAASPVLAHPAAFRVASLDDERLLTACADDALRLWTWSSGELACPPVELDFERGAARLLEDGRIVAASRSTGLVAIETHGGTPVSFPQPVRTSGAIDALNLLSPGPDPVVHIPGWDRYDLAPPDPPPLEEGGWQRLAELASARTVREGAIRPLSSGEWLERWKAHRREVPATGAGFSRARLAAWHRNRARVLEAKHQFDPAAWHLQRLGRSATRADRERLARIRRWLRAWRFAPSARTWHGANTVVPDPRGEEGLSRRRLDELDPAARERIAASARSAPLVASGGPYIDLRAHYAERSLVLGYAWRAIRSETARRVRAYAGSDDTLRVWLRGEEVFASGNLGHFVGDYHEFDLELAAGENELLVEVGQSGGAWGFSLRLEDEAGRDLWVDPGGTLQALE